jgi:hypothetical protein
MESPDRRDKKVETGHRRILERDLFLFLLDMEVKRARRYQNFLSILILKLVRNSLGNSDEGLEACYSMLVGLLNEEMRESDIIGSLAEDGLIVLLPYADITAGSIVRNRFEALLKYYDLKGNGYEVSVRQVGFPTNGTSSIDLIRKAGNGEIA